MNITKTRNRIIDEVMVDFIFKNDIRDLIIQKLRKALKMYEEKVLKPRLYYLG